MALLPAAVAAAVQPPSTQPGGDDEVVAGKEVYIIDRTEDNEERMLSVMFQNDSDLKVYLRGVNVGGLLEVADEGGLSEASTSTSNTSGGTSGSSTSGGTSTSNTSGGTSTSSTSGGTRLSTSLTTTATRLSTSLSGSTRPSPSSNGGTCSNSSVSAGGAQKPMRLVTKWHQLEDGKAYQLDSSGPLRNITAMRQELTHLRKRREEEFMLAVRDKVSQFPNNEECQLAPELRILAGPSGRDEMELDGVVTCRDTIYITSHKTHTDAMTPVNRLNAAVESIYAKSTDPAYTLTKYAAFAGKKIVPVFMAEFLDEKQKSRILDQCRSAGVRVGARSGNNISISARMPQAAKPACSMRFRVFV